MDGNSSLEGVDRGLAMERTGLGECPAIAELVGVVQQGRCKGMAVVEDMIVAEICLDTGEPVRLKLYRTTFSLFREQVSHRILSTSAWLRGE